CTPALPPFPTRRSSDLTVWNYPHIGNYRAFLVYDLLRRQLRLSGYEVLQVMNITDVDDRIIEQAVAAGVTIGEFTRPFEQAFFRSEEHTSELQSPCNLV